MAQGFVLTQNLIESFPADSDSNTLDNIGGLGTANTFNLFDGNSKFISRLYRYEFDVINVNSTATDDFPTMSEEDKSAINNKFTVSVTTEGRVAFSNGAEIALVNAGASPTYDHVVFNSNGIDKFQVKAKSDISSVPTQIDISGFDYIQRKDTVTPDNMNFYSVNRLTANASTDGSSEDSGGNIYGNKRLSDKLDSINSQLKDLLFKKTKLPIGYESTAFTDQLDFTGCITAKNTLNTAITNTTTGNAIYISGNSNESAQRINSDSSSVPFNTSTSNVITSSVVKVEVGDFEVNPGDKLVTESTTSVFDLDVSAEASVVQADTTNSLVTFTHKMPININGEEYFLLMSKE